ncbi:hypothetical protein SETIT_6G218100v2 [Setaria italica]|uniref:Uncharacterized protein n=1 Tax=Setaria italica TaxID=4555 RepID=A0A368RP97_SETIT|nr:hypothetical protein SETIT_6G218100v2 [Setaria italica]
MATLPPAADGPGNGHDVDTAVVAVGLHRRGPLHDRNGGPTPRIALEQGAERVGEVAGDGEVGRAADAVVVDEAGARGAGGVVDDEEGPVGAALGDGGVGVVVDGEQHEAAGGEAERLGDGGRVGEVVEQVGDGGREQEEVVAEVGGEVGEVEGDEAVVDEAGPAEDGEVGADEHDVAVAQHPLLPLLLAGGGGGGARARAHRRRAEDCQAGRRRAPLQVGP